MSCKGVKKNGEKCKYKASVGDYCKIHAKNEGGNNAGAKANAKKPEDAKELEAYDARLAELTKKTGTSVVRMKRHKGEVVQDCDVYVGRRMHMGGWELVESKWANPYKVGKDGTREEVLEKYRKYVLTRKDLIAELPELHGKTLGCWCKPEPCHGDVLLELVAELEQ